MKIENRPHYIAAAFGAILFGCIPSAVAAVPDTMKQDAVLYDPALGGAGLATSNQGRSVAASADGNTVIIGAPYAFNGEGGASVLTRRAEGWVIETQLHVPGSRWAGSRVAVSGDGNTVVMSAPAVPAPADGQHLWGENLNDGGCWVFTRRYGVWSAAVKLRDGTRDVAISGDGNTIAALHGFSSWDAGIDVIVRIKGAWTGGATLSFENKPYPYMIPVSVAVSGDGKATAGGMAEASFEGAFVWRRAALTEWSFESAVPISAGATHTNPVTSVALSWDGSTIAMSETDDEISGAAWVAARSNGSWSTPERLHTYGHETTRECCRFGASIAMSADGSLIVVGAPLYDRYRDPNLGDLSEGMVVVFDRKRRWPAARIIPMPTATSCYRLRVGRATGTSSLRCRPPAASRSSATSSTPPMAHRITTSPWARW